MQVGIREDANAQEEEEEEYKHSLAQRGLNLSDIAQADLLEGREEACTLA